MASPKRSRLTNQRAFTLIEVIVVIAIVAAVGAFTIAIGLDSYRVNALTNEERILVSALNKARAASLNNLDETPHGVAIHPATHPNDYVLFSGSSYAMADHAKDEVVISAYAVQVALNPAASPTEIVFGQLSATSTYEGAIVLTDTARSVSRQIDINREGRISH